HDNLVVLRHDFFDLAGFTFVFTGQDDDFVAFFHFKLGHGLQNLRCQRNDFHEVFTTQFAGNRAKDTRADRFARLVDQDSSVAIETDHGTIIALQRFGGTDDNGFVNGTFFNTATRNSVFNGYDNNVADAGGAAFGATQYLNALYPTCAAVVSDVEVGFHLNHSLDLSLFRRGYQVTPLSFFFFGF